MGLPGMTKVSCIRICYPKGAKTRSQLKPLASPFFRWPYHFGSLHLQWGRSREYCFMMVKARSSAILESLRLPSLVHQTSLFVKLCLIILKNKDPIRMNPGAGAYSSALLRIGRSPICTYPFEHLLSIQRASASLKMRIFQVFYSLGNFT